MLADTFRLRFGIVGGFPFGELIARDALVLFLPLFFVRVFETKYQLVNRNIIKRLVKLSSHRFSALRASHRTTIGTDQSLLTRSRKESGRTLNAPLEVRIFHQSAITQFPLKQIVYAFVQYALQHQIEIGKVLEHIVFAHPIGVLQFGQLTERTRAIVYAALGDLNGKIVLCTILTATMLALQHCYDLVHWIFARAQFAILLQQTDCVLQ